MASIINGALQNQPAAVRPASIQAAKTQEAGMISIINDLSNWNPGRRVRSKLPGARQPKIIAINPRCTR
ncbi:MAG: hypothetical protein CMF72_19535 [Mameliella sp.]|nr:hypothetical protein [Mameliella sp.]